MKYRIVLIALALVVFGSISTVSAKDDWIEVRSKNFTLVGNASEKEIRRVATKLEQFRETFRLLFKQASLSSPVPTTVFVFKNNSTYRPFKPKRSDGKPDDGIAGYFQPGEDINYITLSTEGEDADTFGTIFHEFVHSIVDTNFGRSEVPTWFNEGLAEYYQTFQIEQDQKVKLGLLQGGHLMLLQRSQLMPLEQLFRVSNYQLHATGGHSRSIFYAQSWALIHYFVQTGKSDAMNEFLRLSTQGVPQEKAFTDAFKISYAQMDKELRQYVSKSSYQYNEFSFKNKLIFDSEMITTLLPEPQVDALLGDLLLHSNRVDDAEPYLARAIAGEPASVLANTAMGMVKMRQRKWSDAKKFLDVAVAGGTTSHLPYYRYAYILSRESQDEFGGVREYPKESAERMRKLLLRAIELAPSFGDSYELLAYISLVNEENFDDAIVALRKAQKYQPHNQRYALRIAEILMRQRKFEEAGKIADRIAATAVEPEIKKRAESVVNFVAQWKKYDEQRSENTSSTLTGGLRGDAPVIKVTSEAELEKYQAEAKRRWITESLRKLVDGETRVLGKLTAISCKQSPVVYTISTATETIALSSKDFEGLAINVYSNDADGVSVGCDAKIDHLTALVTYKNAPTTKPATRGEIVAIEFVASDFIPMTAAELATKQPVLIREMPRGVPGPEQVVTSGGSEDTQRDLEKERRDSIYAQMRSSIRVPAEGEKREIGFLETIECNKKGRYLKLKTNSGILMLDFARPQIRMFTRDLEGLTMGCDMRAVEYPAVVVYSISTDKKDKHAGTVLTLDFVPKAFTLEP